MLRSFVLGIAATFIAAPALAGNCGAAPTTPSHFDPASAAKEDILKLKSEFEAYKTANTAYIKCMRKGSTSPTDQREIDSTIAAEQEFAKAFNANAKSWAKAQRS
ncbi:MAG: hypothetical protein AAF337_10395 [Pseudomonadota bacterium]